MWQDLLRAHSRPPTKSRLALIGTGKIREAQVLIERLFPSFSAVKSQSKQIGSVVASTLSTDQHELFFVENYFYLKNILHTSLSNGQENFEISDFIFCLGTGQAWNAEQFLADVLDFAQNRREKGNNISVLICVDSQIGHQDLDYLMQFVRSRLLMLRPAVIMLELLGSAPVASDSSLPPTLDYFSLMKNQKEILLRVDFQFIPPLLDTQQYINIVDETFDHAKPFRLSSTRPDSHYNDNLQQKRAEILKSINHQEFLSRLVSSGTIQAVSMQQSPHGKVAQSSSATSSNQNLSSSSTATSTTGNSSAPNNQVLQSFFNSLLKKGPTSTSPNPATANSTSQQASNRSLVEQELNRMKNKQ